MDFSQGCELGNTMSNVIKEKIRVTAASGQSARETVGQTRGEEFSFLPLSIQLVNVRSSAARRNVSA